MELSILIAKLYGIFLILFGMALILDPKHYRKTFHSLTKDSSLLMLYGMIALIIGMLIVIYHNTWTASWEVIITVIGWIGILKGALIILFPKHLSFWKPLFHKDQTVKLMGLVCAVLGLALGYFGFLA